MILSLLCYINKGNGLSPQAIYEKTRSFFWYYNINRHKMSTIMPDYHAEGYSPDDNRFDLRPFLYLRFEWPWRKIEVMGVKEASSGIGK
jgi:NAD+ synthase (glutamine-hydrolysing)